MKPYGWDGSFDEQSSSKKEAEELKEIASMISNMERTEASSSFHARLKKDLLSGNNKQGSIFARFISLILDPVMNRGPLHLRPIYAVAVAVFLFLTLSTFSNGLGISPIREGAVSIEDRKEKTEIVVNGEEEENGEDKRTTEAPAPGDDEKEDREEDKKQQDEVEKDKEDKEDKEEEKEERDTLIAENGEKEERESEKKDTHEEDSDAEEEKENEKDPRFEIIQEQRTIEIAGNVKLPPFYYPAADESEQGPVESVDYSWPHKFVMADVQEEPFASKEWSRELLSEEGFKVQKEDLQIKIHEEEEKNYAEILFRPEGSSSGDPPLIVHAQKGEGILSYYYEEGGEGRREPGYYEILSPRRAFTKYIDSLEVSAPYKEVNFSINKVWLTYSEFAVEKEGEEELQKLPAYGFEGILSEQDSAGEEEFELYLPAL